MRKNKYKFDTNHLDSDLKKLSLRSGAITLTSQGLKFVIQLGSTMILARILSPADYGINAMAVAITGFANVFNSLGLSTATIQRAEINHEQVSVLFWINAGVGLLLSLIVAALSPLVAWFYKTPEMLGVMLALSSIFVINGMAVQQWALLNRQMRFFSIAKIQVFSLCVGIVVAIVAAQYGLGYWALVLNCITNAIMNAIGPWLTSGWAPRFPQRNVGIGPMVKFGSNIAGFDIINYFARNLDNILIGRYHGTGALGLYSNAYQLLMMPITNLRNPMINVALPALSRLQHEPEKFRNYYLKCVSLLSFMSMPLVVFMFVFSDQLINLLLGSQWLGATAIFKLLAIAAFVQPVSGTVGMVLIASGRSRVYLILGAINSTVICLSFILGLPWGARGIATAYAVANFLILLPTLFFGYRKTIISFGGFFLSIYRPVIASFVMGGFSFQLLHFINDINPIFGLTFCFVLSLTGYILTFVLFAGGRRDILEYLSYVKLLFKFKNDNF